MPKPDIHPLVEFVHRVFGPQGADLLLAGYGEEQPRKTKKLQVIEESAGTSTEWVVEMDGKYLPSGQEPLILAALLKLLLQRPALTTRVEFGMGELIEEIGWDDGQAARSTIDRVITGYAALFFYKEPRKKRGGGRVGIQRGPYSLITAYIRGSAHGGEDEVPIRVYSYVEFELRFVEGLKRGQVGLADIYLGPLSLKEQIINSAKARPALLVEKNK
jgi:hypothetical protein